jgi:hypothetical protein
MSTSKNLGRQATVQGALTIRGSGQLIENQSYNDWLATRLKPKTLGITVLILVLKMRQATSFQKGSRKVYLYEGKERGKEDERVQS